METVRQRRNLAGLVATRPVHNLVNDITELP
jgi:hypothetical protein